MHEQLHYYFLVFMRLSSVDEDVLLYIRYYNIFIHRSIAGHYTRKRECVCIEESPIAVVVAPVEMMTKYLIMLYTPIDYWKRLVSSC